MTEQEQAGYQMAIREMQSQYKSNCACGGSLEDYCESCFNASLLESMLIRKLDGRPPRPLDFPTLGKFYSAMFAIDFEAFDEVLRRVLGATKDYTKGCWGQYQSNPLGYILSRSPASQGEELLKLIISKMKD